MFRRNLENKKITMSIPEYFALQRGEITLEELYKNRQQDEIIGKILSNPYLKKITVLLCVTALSLQTFTVYGSVGTDKINQAGSTVLMLLRTCGYWVCIIVASKDILSCLMKGDTKSIGGVLLKCLTAFGGFYSLPWLFDLIKDILV